MKDVSFEVLKGDSLGLIGLNGSGKSTMLKTIAGVLKPTEGSVTVNGIVAPLIELGAGFDFDLTAKENIYLNGAILGHSRTERFYGCPGKKLFFRNGLKTCFCNCDNWHSGYTDCG